MYALSTTAQDSSIFTSCWSYDYFAVSRLFVCWPVHLSQPAVCAQLRISLNCHGHHSYIPKQNFLINCARV